MATAATATNTFQPTVNKVDQRKPTASYREPEKIVFRHVLLENAQFLPAAVGPTNAPRAKVEVQMLEMRAYVVRLSGNPLATADF